MDVLLGLVVGLVVGAAAGVAWARSRTATITARAKAAEEKVAYVEERLTERFQALSAQALDASNQRFLELAGTRLATANAEAAGELDKRIAPLKDTLGRVEEQLREVETGRRESHAMLAKQVEFVRQSSDQLRRETHTLVRALQRPEARGRWGELQLRRVVEISGMTRHCDFDEQATAEGGLRPDMVVRLSGGKNIIVDSKVSLAAYLEAAGADEPEVWKARLDAHARHLRDHVDRLAAKAYWRSFSPSPEFVVLFVPGRGVPGARAGPRPGTPGVRDAPPGAHRHSHDARDDAAHRALRVAAGGAVGRTPAPSSSWAGSCTSGSARWAATSTSSASRSRTRSSPTTAPWARWRAAYSSPRGG